MRSTLLRLRVAAGVAAVFLLVAACGSEGTASSGSADPADPAVEDVAAEPADTAEQAAATEALFAGLTAEDPGCTAAVGLDGAVAYAGAWGSADLAAQAPMTPDTVVDIGSVSKQFTATAIALLAERGDLDLDDVVSVQLSGLPAWADEVTLRQLVHHTSGITDYVDLLGAAGYDFADPTTDADASAVLADAPELDFPPGTSWEYSNSNYFLLGQVVSAVTGQSLGSFLQSEVFTPLGMDAVMDPVAVIPGKAVSYEFDGDDWAAADSAWQQTGDGGIQTTPTQLVGWASQYWAPTIGGPDIDTTRLEDAVDTDEDGERYGFGIIETTVDGEQVLMHTGAWAGFASSFVVAPDEQLAVAVTCASNESVPDADSGDIGLDVLAAWLP